MDKFERFLTDSQFEMRLLDRTARTDQLKGTGGMKNFVAT